MKRHRKVLFCVLRSAAFLLVLAVMLLRLDSALKLLHRDGLNPRYYKFPRNTFDVVFLGSSVLKFSVLPMELYGEYGIASFNLSSGNQSPGMSYYLAKEAIEKDHPDLIVLECGRAFFEEKPKEAPYIHYITDAMPYYSGNRIGLIRDLAEEEDRKTLLLPLIEYHSRWQELTGEDPGLLADELLYGARMSAHTVSAKPFEEPEIIPDYISASSLEYIEKTIELCRENKTSLLLLSMPILGENNFFDQRGYNYRASVAYELGQIAEKEGVLYADFFGKEEELGLDPETDGYDGEHLNRWGAEKFSRQLGKFLCEQYDLPDRRGAGGKYSVIAKDYGQYPVTRMKESLMSARTLQDYSDVLTVDAGQAPVEEALVLMALGGTAQDGKISTEDDALLKRFGITQDLSAWEGHGWIAVLDGGKVIYETASSGDGAAEAFDPAGSPAPSTTAKTAPAPSTTAKTADPPGEEGEAGEGKEAEPRDHTDRYEGRAGKLTFCVTSGKKAEDGTIKDGLSFVVNGQHYELPENGLQFAVFDKSTGELMDVCRMNRENRTMRCVREDN